MAQEIKQYQDQILEIRANLINYALKWNYTYARWRKIMTLMIFKEVWSIQIH